MPWKLVSFLSVLVVITLFIGFNLENRCDVSLIVYTYKNVPIFVSLLFAYVVGALTTIPFFLASGPKRRNPKKNAAKKGRSPMASLDDAPDYDID